MGLRDYRRKRDFSLTHPDKVLFPDQGITKLRLAEWYEAAADWMLPHVANRPLMLLRCPEGEKRDCFYQKHVGKGLPEGVLPVPIQENKKTAHHMMVDSVQGLVGLVQMGVLEVHTWGTRDDAIERPDLMVLDLDPDPALPWEKVVSAAMDLRRRLASLGLRSFLKTTGGKGLHVVSPLKRGPSWETLKEFSHAIARRMEAEQPDLYTSVMSKARRKGKIYVDYLRNARGATFIAPYSTRRRSGAPVAMPIAWKELTPSLKPDAFTLEAALARLAKLRRDPWSGFEAARRPVPTGAASETTT